MFLLKIIGLLIGVFIVYAAMTLFGDFLGAKMAKALKLNEPNSDKLTIITNNVLSLLSVVAVLLYLFWPR
jgi:hypothetical protein